MHYQKIVEYIDKNYPKDKERLMNYLNSDLFEMELDKLMVNQLVAGEFITEEMAEECLIDSQFQSDKDEDIGDKRNANSN